MDLKFKVSGRIAKPVAEVFEAVVDPKSLSQYFTTGGAKGRLEKGSTVTWDFADFPGAFLVKVVEVVKDKRIVLHWGAGDDAPDGETLPEHDTTVTMAFEALDDGRTLVSISEEGWRETAKGLVNSYRNCEGWTGMLAAMRVWLENGLHFRDGYYK